MRGIVTYPCFLFYRCFRVTVEIPLLRSELLHFVLTGRPGCPVLVQDSQSVGDRVERASRQGEADSSRIHVVCAPLSVPQLG